MDKIVFTFEAFQQNGNAQIKRGFNRDDYYVQVNIRFYSEYPCQYDDGSIVYSHPEAIPQYLKNLVIKAFEQIKRYKKGVHGQ